MIITTLHFVVTAPSPLYSISVTISEQDASDCLLQDQGFGTSAGKDLNAPCS